MGQKVNPISLRLQKTNRFYESSWYSNQNYNLLLSQDLTIRGYLNSVLKQIRYPQGRFFFKYMHKKVRIYSFLHNPHRSRKERANLLPSQRPFKARFPVVNPLFRAQMTGQIIKPSREASIKNRQNQRKDMSGEPALLVCQKAKESIVSKQTTRLRNHLNIVKKSFCYLKNLQNLNKQRVNSLFYMFHGLSFKNQDNFNRFDKITMFTLEKQFYIRYFLSAFLSRKISFSSDYKTQILSQFDARQRKNLVNNFLMFRLLEKEVGTLLSTKYCEKPIFSGLKDINLEIYPKTKNRNALLNRAFTKFYSNFANNGENYLASQTFGSSATPVMAALSAKQNAERSVFLRLQKVKIAAPLQQLLAAEQVKQKASIVKKQVLKDLVDLKKVSTFIIKDTPYRNHLESTILKRLDFSVELFSFQAFSDSQSAIFLANEIAFYLEQRVPFRRIKTRFFKDIAKKNWIKGIRISCSGRLGGRSKKAQRSKTECVKLGQTSLHVFSSKMDFAYKSALTPFGLIGVKVWISYK